MVNSKGWLMGWLLIGLVAGVSGAVSADADASRKPSATGCATQPAIQPATRPATRPADAGRPLFLIGDRITVTQSEFAQIVGTNVDRLWPMRERVLSQIFESALFKLYVQDHPELVTDEKVEQHIRTVMERVGASTREEFEQYLAGRNISMEDYLQRARLEVARANLIREGMEKSRDEEVLARLWATRREEFDGTYVKLRHIMFRMPHYATPEQRAEIRRTLTEMREDMRAGRRTWAECVAESDSSVRGGELGGLRRHGMGNEFLMEVAFKLEPGEISEIVETPLGYHIIQVTERVKGTWTFEQAKREMQRWLRKHNQIEVFVESFRRYPVVGVSAPTRPTAVATQPAERQGPPTLADLEEHLARRRSVVTQPTTGSGTRQTSRPAQAARPIRPLTPATQPAGSLHGKPTTRPDNRP